MKFITLETTEKFDEFYKGSDLTFAGMLPEEAQLYVDYFKENGAEVNEEVDGYIYTGKMMNEKYNLSGDTAFPEDLHFLTIPLQAFDLAVVTLLRMGLGGRWFDDIVDNKLGEQNEKN